MKKRMWICMILILSLLVQIPITAQNDASSDKDIKESTAKVQAEQTVIADVRSVTEESMGYGTVDFVYDAAMLDDTNRLEKVKKVLVKGMRDQETAIRLSEYDVTIHELVSIMQDIVYSVPELFYITGGYSYSYYGNYVIRCMPIYTMTGDELASAKAFYEDEIERILEESGALAVEDDLLQALLLNDYIASHYQYDTTYTIHDVYTMLKEGTAVCQGYTLLYNALLSECDIDNGYAVSRSMNHIWTLVEIDDEYYHVDVTWADPLHDKYSLVSHNYFMLSDDYIGSYQPGNRHYNWTSSDGIVCDSGKYDGAMFTDARSPFVFCDGEIYYIDNYDGTLCRYVDAMSEGDVLKYIGDDWFSANGWVAYSDTYSGLASVDGKLYFNTTNSIGCYDPATEKLEKNILTVDEDALDIVGLIWCGERTLLYALAPDAASEVAEIRSYVIPKEELTIDPYDVNCDGIMNIDDVNELLKYLAGELSEDADYHVDVNEDGYINIDDLNTVLIALSTAK